MSHSTIGGGGGEDEDDDDDDDDDEDDDLTQENSIHEEVCFTDCYTRVLTGHQS